MLGADRDRCRRAGGDVMSTDKELLELAAKAAGIDLDYRRSSNAFYFDDPETGREQWCPLDDDGQALRLAVKLQLTVCNEHVSSGVAYCIHEYDACPEVRSGIGEDEVIEADYAATRRAIVLAAAEIGKAMP